MDAQVDALLVESLDGLPAAERIAVAYQWETLVRRMEAVRHRLVAAVAELPKADLGDRSPARALSTALRISKEEARRRVKEAADLAPRRGLTGQDLEPVLAHTAAAQRRGAIGAEHIAIIRRFFRRLPGFIDATTRQAAEADLAHIASGLPPEELRAAAEHLAVLLDAEGELTDADRARRSYFSLGKQQPDGMTPVRGNFDPELAALWEAVAAKWAAPGMLNPDDPTPRLDGQPTPEQAGSDQRTVGKRNHDALKAVLRAILASGELGSHNGLPVTMVISTTLGELESGTGHATTGGATLLPMSEVIRQAAHAYHYLAVFDDHTQEPLYLGRAKRLASKAQRLLLYARDRGCTRPGCTAPAYHCHAHHIDGWAKNNAPTDITALTLACPADDLLIETTDWTTRTRPDGRTEWIPPPHLDTGQTRVNNYHHPERYLTHNRGHDDDSNDKDTDDDPP
ncbi:HNH endonuclease signature motif containing protein [Mycolicibacterium agri]|nr:HNH endonuclease signature motif containing protein [Mycolicibacterium agri]